MVIKMQNIWVVGLVLASLLGAGTVMGLGAMDGHDGMHHMMHGEHYEDCHEYEECEYEHEECLEHLDGECIEEHEDCDMDEHMMDHDC
jgi:hypothetical protein